MKTKNNKHRHKSVHQYIEEALRHRLSLVVVAGCMCMAALSFDGRVRGVMAEAYSHGWTWIGNMHHEHPMHNHHILSLARNQTISGPGPAGGSL